MLEATSAYVLSILLVRRFLLTTYFRIQKMYEAALEDIILQYTYPRLDAEVSKHRNHLLKAPFCVHPKTGRVCVPVDPDTIDEFKPEKVPTVGQLLRELDEAKDTEGSERQSGMWISLQRIYVADDCISLRLGEDITETLCGNAG